LTPKLWTTEAFHTIASSWGEIEILIRFLTDTTLIPPRMMKMPTPNDGFCGVFKSGRVVCRLNSNDMRIWLGFCGCLLISVRTTAEEPLLDSFTGRVRGAAVAIISAKPNWPPLMSRHITTNLERVLRQGDPLSPFLFILAVEALNVALVEAIDNNLFHGVPSEELYSMAFVIGCLASQFPCTYLGLPIGAKMLRCRNWEPLFDRFQKRLSKWKANSLSFGGRLTLIKSVLGSMSVYYFSTFKAPKKIIHKLEGIRRRWNKLISLKVNILAWRVSNKRIPTRYNLDRRGIDLHSTRCLVCDNDIETEEHLFVKCPIAIASWKMEFSWWQLVDIPFSNLGDVLTVVERTPMTKVQKSSLMRWLIQLSGRYGTIETKSSSTSSGLKKSCSLMILK
nr:reverse transcriptase domain, zinc finger, CCHC-type [Tanacetum cinerariifolium]